MAFRGAVGKAHTDGSTMSTSMGMEAISFSEQATAARRDYFAGSNSGVQDVRDVGDVVEKFTAPPRVPAVASRSEASSSEWGPLYIGRLQRRPLLYR